MCILEMRKVLMYVFHYNYIKSKYDNKSKLLFLDTDSLMYEIKTDYNKLVIGKTKDETGCLAIEEFVGLKPKMYSFLADDNSKHKKSKGVNKNVVATVSHNEYRDALLHDKCLINEWTEFKVKTIE